MRPVADIQDALAAATDRQHGRRLGKQLAPLRGLRGVPGTELTRILVESWTEGGCSLPDDVDDLQQLFLTAFDDGLVAIGLAATCLPDAPAEVEALAQHWLGLVDDIQTADALGWLLWGPALIALQRDFSAAAAAYSHASPAVRRAAVMTGMAALPVAVEGPTAAALRQRMGTRRISFVLKPQDAFLDAHLTQWMRDEDPHVRRSCARMLREWAAVSPDAAESCALAHKGGLPKFLRAALEKGLRKGRRPARHGAD
jgi:hypothetical protein